LQAWEIGTCWLNAEVSIVQGKRVDREDGRVVRTLEAGALGGSPILVFHPTPSSRLFVRQHADAALRTGVRLIGFSRPGSGGSTMAAPGLRVVAGDAVRVADAAGVEGFTVLGFSGGTPFAAATAALFPDRVRAVGLCAAVAPWQEIGDRGVEFDDELERHVALAESDLAAALDAARARGEREFAGRLALDDNALAAQLAADASAPDREALTPVLAMAQAITLRDAFDQDDDEPEYGPPKYDGYAFDELAFSRPWDVDVRAVTAPTWVWQGSVDVVTPLEHAQWYAARIAGASLVVRHGRGHLSSFETHRDEMFATLRDALG
jgi:pimeloyl-ACP methyl ester carboxylesterase